MSVLEFLPRVTEDIRGGKPVDIRLVSELLNHFCENPIVEEGGVTIHPFTDPVVADTLNGYYRKETGVDHNNYIDHALPFINGLLRDEEALTEKGAYKKGYFEQLRAIKERIQRERINKKR